jgi:aminotransferase
VGERGLIGVSGAATGPEEVAAAGASIAEAWMGMGPRVRELEAALSERLGVDFAMTDSGSNALQLAVHALRLPPESEVVLPSFTWVACANAVVLAGHRPVFADVDLETGNSDAELLGRAMTRRTRAVMAVHYAGRPVDVAQLLELGVPVVEDAAHAIDSALDGHRCGTLGHVSVFSFDAVKNVATPDGGGVASRDPDLIASVRRLRYCGIGASGFDRSAAGGRWWEQDAIEPFPRAIPNDVSAGVALAQLDRLEANQAARNRVWDAYQRELAGLTWLELPPEPSSRERHSYFTFLVRVVDGRRDLLAQALLEEDIYTTLRYQPLHLVPPFDGGPSLPNAEALAEEGLNLPLHPGLSDDDVARVIDAVCRF